MSKRSESDAETVRALEEITRVLQIEGRAIVACAERWNSNEEARRAVGVAVDLLQAALDRGGKIVVTGVGKSGKIAQKIAATLCSTGGLAVYLHPTEGLHGDLGLLTSNDAVLALSYSGNSEELVRLLPSLKSLRVPIVGIGGRKDSQLGQSCDAWLDASVAQEACPHNLAPTSSTTLALAIGDAIAVTLMQRRGFDPGAFARNHPGGALGSRLHLRVADLMHPASLVATVGIGATMDEVVVQASRAKHGAVLVVEGDRLVGIVTDGDIRRALQHREKFFDLKASDVMTRQPITTTPDTRAIEALELMENRPSQIAVLPVVEAGTDRWVGLVRLHDLVRSL